MANDEKHPITDWREANGKSQADLADALRVTRWTINSIEVGRRTPSMQLAKAIAAHTGLSLEAVTAPAPKAERVA